MVKIEQRFSMRKRPENMGTFCHTICYFLLYFLGGILIFSYYIQHCFICRPSDTDAGIEPRTVATGALAVRRSNHYRLDLIRNMLWSICKGTFGLRDANRTLGRTSQG
jgi:hypothetical protein